MINVILLHSNSLGGTEKFLHESYLYLKKKESAFMDHAQSAQRRPSFIKERS